MFNKDTFSTLLKTAIGSNRTITEFSNECNLARPYISKFINCKLDTPPSPEAISKIASAARNNISECDLLVAAGYTTYDNHMDDILYNFESGGDLFSNSIKYKTSLNKKYAKLISDVKPKKIPVLYNIDTDNMNENISRYLAYYEFISSLDTSIDSYYLYAKDDSMLASGITIDTLVHFIPQDYAEDNDLVVVLIEGSSFIRRYRKINNIITFMSDNSSFDSFAYLNSDYKKQNAKIIGKVTHSKTAF
jgi:SOS-response transcriptional repressor LexA